MSAGRDLSGSWRLWRLDHASPPTVDHRAASAALRYRVLANGQVVWTSVVGLWLVDQTPASASAPRGRCRVPVFSLLASGQLVWGRGSRLDRGTPAGFPGRRPSGARVMHRFPPSHYLSFFILGKATWRELLVGAVDNLAKPVLARVCEVLKINLRDRLHVGAGQVARWRGTGCTWITLPATTFPYGSDSRRRGTDYTWTTLLNHRVVRAGRTPKRIEARRGRDAAGGSMRSTKAWPQRSWGETNELVFWGAPEAQNPPWPPPKAPPNCPATRPART